MISEHRRLIFVTAMGGFLEYYDFVIYALMAGYIADAFFPAHDPISSLLGTYATFAAGYLIRPLGGLVFGHFGDRYGRKPTFVVSVFIMALSTTLIGCLPTYDQIGLSAPVFLVLLRALQGFSVGGEIPGAITYLSETVSKEKGLTIGLLLMGILNGLFFGSLVQSLMHWWLTPEQMAGWGWRLPFWLGGSLGVFSYIIRKDFQESQLFLEKLQQHKPVKAPVRHLLALHGRSVAGCILMIIPASVSISIFFLFMPGYLTKVLNYNPSDVGNACTIAVFCTSLCFVLFGKLADRYSAKKMFTISSILTVIVALPVFYWFFLDGPVLTILLLCTSLTSGTSLAPLLISQSFPVEVRYSGIGISYSLGLAIFGGLAPVVSIALIQSTGSLMSPAWVLIVGGLLGSVSLLLLPVGSVSD